jgi:hypothetical protein
MTTTPTSCAYHPDRAAVDSCFQCQKAICAECREAVAGRSMCQNCIAEIRNRVVGQPAASAAPVGATYAGAATPPPYPGAGATSVPPLPSLGTDPATPPSPPYGYGAAQSGVPGVAAAYRPAPPALTGGRVFAGMALGFVVGLVTMILWVVLVVVTGFNIVFAAIGVGYATGWAVWKGCGQGGKTPSLIAGVLGLLFSLLGVLITHLPELVSHTFRPWSIIFSLLCVGYGTLQAYNAPQNFDSKV